MRRGLCGDITLGLFVLVMEGQVLAEQLSSMHQLFDKSLVYLSLVVAVL